MSQIVKNKDGTINCIRDKSSGTEIKPEDLNLSNKHNKINVQLLKDALEYELFPPVKPGLFDLLNDISSGSGDLINGNEKTYSPFVINNLLSYSNDCIFHVNEMNLRGSIDGKYQYKYLSGSVRKKKRFNRTHKVTKEEDVEIISKIYHLSYRKAAQILDIVYQELGELPKYYKDLYKKL